MTRQHILQRSVELHWNRGNGHWQDGVSRDITQCAESDDLLTSIAHDISRVDGNIAYFGDDTSGFGDSEATRPTSLYLGAPFTRQQSASLRNGRTMARRRTPTMYGSLADDDR